MRAPAIPADEAVRLRALHLTELLDTPAEERFDRLTRLAQHTFGVPIALVSLVDEHRQWFKSRQGLSACETSREISFCGHAILGEETLEVPDARLDPRFADNPLVTGELGIRFYAGAPLFTAQGHRIGTLCLIDDQPRSLSEAQHRALRDLADCVQGEIVGLEERRLRARLAASTARSTSILHGLHDLALVIDRSGRCLDCNDHPDLRQPRWAVVGRQLADLLPPALVPRCMDGVAATLAGESRVHLVYRLDVPGGAADFEALFQKVGDNEVLILVRNTSREKATQAELHRQHGLTDALARVQLQFIRETDRSRAFDELLADILPLTSSEVGFLAEVLHRPDGTPYLEAAAVTKIGWPPGGDGDPVDRSNEFHELAALAGEALITGAAVVLDQHRPTVALGGRVAAETFLGVPVRHGGELVAMIGLANRPGGYGEEVLGFLRPLAATLGQLVVAARIRRQHLDDLRALERFKSTLERVLDCVFMFDASDLRCFYANEGAQHQVGYTRDELMTMHPWDLAVELSPAQFRELLSPLASGVRDSLRFEVEHRHKLGNVIPVEILFQYITPQNEAARFVAIVRDITERKQAAAERNRIATLLTNVLAAASEFSIIATDPEGTITIFNSGAQRMLGYTAAEVVGCQTPALFHLADEVVARGQELSAELGRAVMGFRTLVEPLEAVSSSVREWTYVRKDGRHFPISLALTAIKSARGEVLGYVGIGQDITDAKAKETMLREQAQHTRTIVDNMLDGVVTCDKDGMIVSFNPAAERIFGHRAEDVIGRRANLLMRAAQSEAAAPDLVAYLATAKSHTFGVRREVEGQRKDGTRFPMELAVSQLERQGRTMCIAMIRDVTDRKRDERMKSEFVSTVSHELRTPLTSITGALSLIVGGALGEVPHEANEMLAIAHANGQRLTALINDLLDMEKISSGNLRFDMRVQLLSPIVEQAIEANRSYGAARGVAVHLVGAPANGMVEVDSLRLTQVLSNLLSNAIKFSPDGGVVEVAVEPRGRSLSVSVRDRGPGIPAAFRERVFQKFAQADASDTRVRGGTGLGLAITRELLERMSGHIEFESVEGAGATFTFDLPNFDQHPATADDTPRVLVVEDEPEVAGHLVQLLAAAGYAADVAVTGAAAFDLLSRTRYAAMTLDLVLPDIGGVEVIRRVRGRPATSELTIVVISAAIQEGQAALADDAVGVAWLAKPLVGNELIAELAGLLARAAAPRRRAS